MLYEARRRRAASLTSLNVEFRDVSDERQTMEPFVRVRWKQVLSGRNSIYQPAERWLIPGWKPSHAQLMAADTTLLRRLHITNI